MRWLITAIGVPLVVLLIGHLITTSHGTTTPSPSGFSNATPLMELQQLAERSLQGTHVPVPGSTSSTLGFGDASLGVRPTFQYVERTPTSGAPVFNSIIDAPFGVGDERLFLRATAGEISKKDRTRAAIDHQAIRVPRGVAVWLWFYIANDAIQQRDCDVLSGPTIAKDVRVRMTVWPSPDRHVHVIRAWISATNATPHWVTAAVAVKTDVATTLKLDPDRSWVYSKRPGRFDRKPSLHNTSLLEPAGAVVGDNGLVGSCWDNRFAYYLRLEQT